MGQILASITKWAASAVQLSPFGVIPKPHKPGKWRLISDLSHPQGQSVNDGILPAWSSLSSVDNVAKIVLVLGAGTELAKIGICNAYRIIPVHPDDQQLLGMQWNDMVYIDCTLLFGLRSAPNIFNAAADAFTTFVILQLPVREEV